MYVYVVGYPVMISIYRTDSFVCLCCRISCNDQYRTDSFVCLCCRISCNDQSLSWGWREGDEDCMEWQGSQVRGQDIEEWKQNSQNVPINQCSSIWIVWKKFTCILLEITSTLIKKENMKKVKHLTIWMELFELKFNLIANTFVQESYVSYVNFWPFNVFGSALEVIYILLRSREILTFY